jgi:hypothetical protein
MNIQLPTKDALVTELERLKNYIHDDCIQVDDDGASLELTLGADDKGFAMQTGDNSYTGAAYSFRHWAVAYLYKDSDCIELAEYMLDQLLELSSDY